MANGDDFTDPSNWQTPEQIQAQRWYAKTLLENSMSNPAVGRSGPFEAVSPWGGAVMAGQGIMGNLLMNRAGGIDKQSRLAGQEAIKRLPIPGYSGQPDYPSQNPEVPPGPSSEASPTSAPWQASIPAIKQIESGGNPNAQTGSYKGLFQLNAADARKYGGYGEAAGIRMLTDEANQLRTVLGREPTGAEVYLAHQQGVGGFQSHMANPNGLAWQNMLNTAEGRQKGPAWAKQAIWGNVPDSMKAQFGSVDHITSRDFTNMWMHRVNSGSFDHRASVPTTGVQLASNAPDLPTGALGGAGPSGATPLGAAQPAGTQTAQAAPAGAPQQMAQVLAGGRGGGGPGPAQVPVPGVGAPAPGYFAPRQMVPDRGFNDLANPFIPENMRDYYNSSRVQQFQPQVLETPTGNWIQPSGGGQPIFQGKIIEKTIKGPGGMEVPAFFQGTPNGGYQRIAPGAQGPPGPRSDIGGPPTAGGGGPAAAAPGAPGGAAATAPTPGPQGAATPPTRLASLETGTMTDATPPGALGVPPSMLNAPPPAGATAGAEPGVTALGPPPKTPKGATPQFAQSMLQQSDRDTFSDMADQAAQADLKTSAAKEAGAEATKFVTDMRTKYLEATDTNSKLKLLDGIVHDPTYYSGALEPLVMLKRRFVAGFGGDPKQAADMELASKFMNDINLGTLKTRLGGLGQIRVFEGNMVERAFLNRENSVVANQALVEYAKRVNDRLLAAGNMMNEEVAKNNGVPSPAIQNKVLEFFAKTPIMTDKETKEWNEKIRADVDAKKSGSGPMGTAPPPPLPPGFKPVQ